MYASVLSTHWPGGAPRMVRDATTTALVIHQETSTSDCMFARGKLIEHSRMVLVANGVVRPLTPDERLARLAVQLPDPTWQPVLDAYLAAQPTIRTILPGQELGVPSRLETRAASDSGPHIQMSAVGFDPARTRAMVNMTLQCGGLCSRGALYLFEKVDGRWREAATPCASACIRRPRGLEHLGIALTCARLTALDNCVRRTRDCLRLPMTERPGWGPGRGGA